MISIDQGFGLGGRDQYIDKFLQKQNALLINLQRVDKIFRNMDLNKDAKLTFDEFKEGSKLDPTIVQVSVRLVWSVDGQMLSGAKGRHGESAKLKERKGRMAARESLVLLCNGFS